MAIYRCSRCGAVNFVKDERSGERPTCATCKTRLDMAGAPQHVTGDAIDRTVATCPVPVLVDFWAPWCGSCRVAAPLIGELARGGAGKLVVLKLDAGSDAVTARRYRIESMPTCILFVGGREVGRRNGVVSRRDLEQWISRMARAA